jgi:hypothetical protein
LRLAGPIVSRQTNKTGGKSLVHLKSLAGVSIMEIALVICGIVIVALGAVSTARFFDSKKQKTDPPLDSKILETETRISIDSAQIHVR